MPSPSLAYIVSLNQLQSVVSRRFDHMGSMVGFTEFIILHHLNEAPKGKLRRIDLADKVGLTASGITRLLLPMEKIGLVGREANPRDARVSLAVLTESGRRVLGEALERAECVAEELVPEEIRGNLAELARINGEIRRRAL